MKKSLSLLLAFALVFGLFASMASAADAPAAPTTADKYKILVDAGVLKGTDNGDPQLSSKLNRAQFATIAAAIAGLKAETTGSTFKDVKAGQWWYGAIVAAAKAGLVNGTGNNLFSPKADVTVESVIKVAALLAGLKPVADAKVEGSSDWAGPYIKAAIDAGLIAARTDYKSAATRGQTIDIAFAAYQYLQVPTIVSSKVVDSKNVEVTFSDKEVVKVALTTALEANKETEITVTYKTKEYKTKVTWKVEEAKVASVTQTNFAEVEVAYTAPIDKDSLKIGNAKNGTTPLVAGDTITLLEDGKTVRIYDASGWVPAATGQQTKLKVSLTGVKSAAGKDAEEVKDKELTFTDLAFPTLVSAKAIGNKKVVLTFSEPVQGNVDSKIFSNYTIDGALVVGSGQPVVNGRTIELTLASGLTAASHKVSVVVGKVKDYANFTIGTNEASFDVVADTTAPTFTITAVQPEKVTLKFSEEISAADIYWMAGLVKNAAVWSKDATDKTIVYASFDNTAGHAYIPLFGTKLVVENAEDYSGNKAAKVESDVNPTADVTRPSVKSVTASKENEIIVEFDEAVNTTGTYTLTDKDGTAVTVSAAYVLDSSNNAVKTKIKLTGNVVPSKNPYKLVVTGVPDLSSLANLSLSAQFVVNVVDTAPPVVTSASTAGDNFSITFDEAVTAASAQDLNSYGYFEAGVGYVSLPSGSSVTLLNDGKSVKVTVPAGWAYNSSTNNRTIANIAGVANGVIVKNIKDAAGNTLLSTLVSVPGGQEVAAAVTNIKATSKNTLELTLDNNVLPAIVYAGDFVVTGDGATLTVTGATLDAANKKIILTIAQDLLSDAQYDQQANGTPGAVTVAVASPVSATKTALGTPIPVIGGLVTTVKDGIKASVSSVTVATNVVSVNFSELINYGIAIDNAALTTALVVKDNKGVRMIPNTDYTAVKGTNKIDITILKTGYNNVVSVALDGIYLQDNATPRNDINSVDSNTGAVSVREGVAPLALTFVQNANSFKFVSATEITIVFNETLDASKFVAASTNGFVASVAGTVTNAQLQADGVTVKLTGTSFGATTEIAYVPGNLADAVGNALAAIAATPVN
ncbi:S-layer homology domain-containing protein [Cohnella silvisoli]|uniref:S-layer homology domain-containing protein n=1 Tax=Cohnella silvisoli TaxID=2873699 RepID=A0ABV1KQI3_9BACL|nr:S-layer homology domain-containing protein [Cohnella silvisoli]MCD9022284.1 S-layer homology domain-containing protein [Cohnella silvisoli]